MKLSKILTTMAFLYSLGNISTGIAATVTPSSKLSAQHLDTTKNIEHYGYKHNTTLMTPGALIDLLRNH